MFGYYCIGKEPTKTCSVAILPLTISAQQDMSSCLLGY